MRTVGRERERTRVAWLLIHPTRSLSRSLSLSPSLPPSLPPFLPSLASLVLHHTSIWQHRTLISAVFLKRGCTTLRRWMVDRCALPPTLKNFSNFFADSIAPAGTAFEPAGGRAAALLDAGDRSLVARALHRLSISACGRGAVNVSDGCGATTTALAPAWACTGGGRVSAAAAAGGSSGVGGVAAAAPPPSPPPPPPNNHDAAALAALVASAAPNRPPAAGGTNTAAADAANGGTATATGTAAGPCGSTRPLIEHTGYTIHVGRTSA